MNDCSNDDSLTIYVAAHKKADIPQLDGYQPIEVGAWFHDDILYDIRDNTGENISYKNKNYCELTAYYWIWKNSSNDYVGLVHYRRFLSKKRIDENRNYYLKKEDALNILQKYDLILPERIKWNNYTVAGGYDHGAGFLKDLDILRKVIEEICPEYISDYTEILSGHEASYCNVFVMKKELFDQYCDWLFKILFETEKRIDLSNYTDAEKRIFGFMSEILINVWIKNKKLNPYYMPMVKCEQKMRKTLKILKLIERIPGTGYFVKKGLIFDFNRQQR